MAELRQRQVSGIDKPQNQPGRYQKTPRPPPSRPTRHIHISTTLLILACFILYANNQRHSSKATLYQVGKGDLPDWYAICSKEGTKVYTVPEEGGVGAVECVVVGGKEVVDTGSLARIRRKWGDKSTIGAVDGSPEPVRKVGGLQIIYLPPGHTMTPGLIDAHGHPLLYGYYSQLPLAGSKSVQEVIDRVERFVSANYSSLPSGAWVEGMGWDQNIWNVKEYPTAGDLDSSPILKGLPISLARIDIHAEWVSPAILTLLGDLPDTIDGGEIVRDESGKPTGVFVDNAIGLIDAIRPPWTDIQREAFLGIATADAVSKGLTGIHDARAPKADLAFYKAMADEGRLGLRIYAMLHCGDTAPYCGNEVEKVYDAQDGRYTFRSAKLFGDGALGSRGAALIDDYSDKPGSRGFLIRPEEDWEPLIRQYYENGWQVNIHGIGDRANKIILDAIESIIGSNAQAKSEPHFRLEHAQIMRVEDVKRATDLGAIGSYQPTHATSDMWYAIDRLGEDRLKGAYAARTFLDNGGRIALGSDFPVESINPLKGFYAAVTRLSELGTSPHGPEGWYANMKLTREEALRGMTVDAAYAGYSNTTGSLVPGKRFDAVVWDDDLMTVDQGEMLEVKVKATLLDGQLVFGSVST